MSLEQGRVIERLAARVHELETENARLRHEHLATRSALAYRECEVCGITSYDTPIFLVGAARRWLCGPVRCGAGRPPA